MFIRLSSTELLIIASVVSVVIIIGAFLVNYVYRKVAESSTMLRELDNLNRKYKFHKSIKKTTKISKACNSKTQYDRLELTQYFMSVIFDSIEEYDKLLSNIDSNRMMLKAYNSDFACLKSSVDKATVKKYLIPLFLYKFVENEIARRRKANPRTDTECIVTAMYVSPKGKNAYRKSLLYKLSRISELVDLGHYQIDKKNTKKYQRTLMSDSLRYDILQRDNFKCQLCGASMKDGATLHVDHIVPVSKGGKTEGPNLQTLCDRCNLGKRDKTAAQ